jgi:CDGSH-type Zn-finger protein
MLWSLVLLRAAAAAAAAAAAPGLHADGHAGHSKVYACQSARSKNMGFCDGSKSFVERTSDLLQRLTTAEKISLMGAHGNDICAFEDGGVPRLDIPSYTWCGTC